LDRLESGDPDAWGEAYHKLHPVAFEAARSRLGNDFQTECEDIAVETLAEILQQGPEVDSSEGLKPLAAAIARNKAIDRLRRFLAEKRGGNKVESLDAMIESGAAEPAGTSADGFLDALTVQDLRDLLVSLSEEVKKEYRVVLRDHYLDQLSHKEIAAKRRIAVGSVGVFIERGLSAMRAAISRTPKMKAELLDLIGDAGAVKALLPLLSAVQIGGWFFDHLRLFALGKIDETRLPDEVRIQLSREDLPEAVCLPESKRRGLMELTRAKYQPQFQRWEIRMEAERQRLRQARQRAHRRILVIVLYCAIGAAAAWVVFRLIRR
jgi:RNA polymerase sigma factor (sigma-70 family)